MNLHKAQKLAMELMLLHGITDYSFRWSRSRRAAGTCKYYSKIIQLSLPLTELADERDVKDTILHEIAHALCPGHGHDYVWQSKAKEIGANGLRCYGMKGQKESLVIAHQLIARYKGVCPNGHEHFKNRMPKRTHSCGRCSRKYDERYLITYGLNV